jgi:hypothetical protein
MMEMAMTMWMVDHVGFEEVIACGCYTYHHHRPPHHDHDVDDGIDAIHRPRKNTRDSQWQLIQQSKPTRRE